MKTRQALITRALQILRIVGEGETPSADDYQKADNLVVPIVSYLETRRIIPFAGYDTFDDKGFIPLSECLAGALAREYSIDRPMLPNGMDAKTFEAENQLRAVYATRPPFGEIVGSYF